MDTLLDILTGIGLASAAGIRPFLPGLAAGAFAASNLTIDFEGTDLAFLEQPGWLLALVIVLIAVVLANRSMGPERAESGPLGVALAAISVGVGALLFAGAVADHSDTWWPGLVGGVAFALLAYLATRDLLARTRSRLDDEAASALTVYAEGAAVVLAVLAILAPPLSVVAVGLLVFLLVGGRRRKGEKYAGLRILR
jgi:FtsH-binding integral membrane protein